MPAAAPPFLTRMLGMGLFRAGGPLGSRRRATIKLAENAVVSGHESAALLMLAGLDLLDEPPTDSELDEYIARCFEEMGYPMPTRDECLSHYTCLVAEDIASGTISPKDGANELRDTYLAARWKGARVDLQVSRWTDLAENANWPYLNPDAPAEILGEARALLLRSTIR